MPTVTVDSPTTIVIQTTENTVEIQTTGAQGDGSGGGGAVASVSAANATLTISPTTGVVLAALNLTNPNTWTGLQTFRSGASVADGLVIDGSSNPYVGAATAYGIRVTRTTNGDFTTPASIVGDSLTTINNGPSSSEDPLDVSMFSIGRETLLTVATDHQFDMTDGGETIVGHRNYVTTTGTFIGGSFARTVYGDEVFVNANNGVNCSGNYVDNIYGRYTKVQVNGATQNGIVSGTIWGHYIQVTNGEGSRAAVGLEIVGVTGAANSYALKVTSTTKSYFAGRVGFNQTSPVSPVDIIPLSSINVALQITAAPAQTADLISVASSAITNIFGVASNGGVKLYSGNTTGARIDQNGTGQLKFSGFGGTNNEDLIFNFESVANTVSVSTSTGVTSIVWNVPHVIPDDANFNFGTGLDASFQFDTTDTNDTLKLGLSSNGANASGTFVICELADINTNFGVPTSTNPMLRIQSADATTVADWIGFYHDQTNAIVRWGGGTLDFLDPSGSTTPLRLGTNQIGLHGATPVSQSTGWSVSNVTTRKTLDADADTLSQLSDFVGTLAQFMLSRGDIAA